MDARIKSKWVEYLRDGTRTQGTNMLRDEEGNQCCLDVLCEIAVEEGVIKPPVLFGGLYIYSWAGTDKYGNARTLSEVGVLPKPVMEWAGLIHASPYVMIPAHEDEYGYVEAETIEVTLDEVNDSYGYSFEMISDLIEEQL